MKTSCLCLLITAATLGFGAAADAPKVLSSKDVPEAVRVQATKEAGGNKITKYRLMEDGNIVADSGNGKNRKLLEFTPAGTYIGYSQAFMETKLPDAIRKNYINTVAKKDCPTCPLVIAKMSTLTSSEKVTPAGSGTFFYRCKGALKGEISIIDYDESGRILKTVGSKKT